jgi:subtilisin family serine protease
MMFSIIRFLLPFSLFGAITFSSFGQTKYWIRFADKDTSAYHYTQSLSPQAIHNRIQHQIPLFQFTDIPVSKKYLTQLHDLGLAPIASSKWLNAVSVRMEASQVAQVKQIPGVLSVEPMEAFFQYAAYRTSDRKEPDGVHPAIANMQYQVFKEAGLNGKGITIGVIDAGFFNAAEDKATNHIINENRIQVQRDFIDPSRADIITRKATNSDGHGMEVLKSIGGYGILYDTFMVQYGLAYEAQFVLARTENGDKEHRVEEDHWIMAMEWMDSLGVRVISTSLGYAINMDDPTEDYLPEEMNGKTARISRAAQIAFDEKGILLVVSAGNEGDNPNWRIVGAPADAKGVLSIGATERDLFLRIGYSSIGPEFLPYLKPNVSTYSPNGTSFSCPSITGFMACLMQNDSTLSNKALYDIVQRSAHLYPYGNNYIGYGVPQADRALELAKDTSWQSGKVVVKQMFGKKVFQYDLGLKEYDLDGELFHKKDAVHVIAQDMVRMRDGKLKVKRFKGEVLRTLKLPLIKKRFVLKRNKDVPTMRSTLTFQEEVTIEIIWE